MAWLLMLNRTMTYMALLTTKNGIHSQKRTWRISAEAYEAEACDFGISCPRYTLPAIMQWHLSYEGPKNSNFSVRLEGPTSSDFSVRLSLDDADLSLNPLVLCPVTNELSLILVKSSVPNAPT